ncbi:S41 family peptidase [Bacillus sp. 2205SS5-2]|uniref:S41 family peptidase n=1 Tax=Bacillus sp. 2205SS5-2 TaxID=3109031 RepID=UPI003003E529
MTKKYRILLGILILFLVAGGGFGVYKWLDHEGPASTQSPNEVELETEELKKVHMAYELILSRYVEDVNEMTLVEGAIQGMLKTLEDPYSVYMDAETAAQFNDSLDSSFEGIGAEVTVMDGKLKIVAPFRNSPAEKAGLKPNDEIISVDGKSIEGLDLYEATLKIRGKKGSKVNLEIKREGLTDSITVSVERAEIPNESVHFEVKEKMNQRVGYIEITSFSQETAKEFHLAIQEIEAEKIEGLIIDVRGNPGGLLMAVEKILATLVTSEKPYLQIEERSGEKMPYYSPLDKKKPYPIAVLIDEGSASASEILAGALQEAGEYPLIGVKTFGKGTVQQAIPLGDGSNIKMTMFKWLTPDGNWIHKKGIQPTIKVEQPPFFHTHPLQVETPLKLEMNETAVKSAQEILYGLGFAPGRTDGYYNEQTKKSVEAFQAQNDLPVTGQIDQKTARKLEEKIKEATRKEKNDLQLQAAIHHLLQQ